MTATDVLRRLLDERGVEWSSPSGLNSSFADSITFIGDVAVVSEIDGSDLLRINFDGTPEQAIAAMLGAGTCHITDNGPWGYPYVCSACGASFDPDVNGGEFNYCPNCGRKVVGE